VKGSVLYYELAKLNSIDIMPVKISYRLSEFLSISTGSLILFNFITHSSSQQTKYFLQSDFPIPPVTVKKEIPASEWYCGSDMAVFADMQMGSVKAGPALGIRFMHCFNGASIPVVLLCLLGIIAKGVIIGRQCNYLSIFSTHFLVSFTSNDMTSLLPALKE
jgi:hypothetical protein